MSKALNYINKVKGISTLDTLTIMLSKSGFVLLRNFLKIIMGKNRAYRWIASKDLSYINFMIKDVTIRTSSGVLFYCRKKKGDLNVVGDHYESDQMEIYFKPKEGDVIIDVGANVGKYALLGCKRSGKKGIVFSIEPDSDCVKIIDKSRYLNKFDNLINLQVAMGKEDEDVSFYQSFDGARHSTTWIPPHEATKITVKQITLDTLMRENKLEKIDWLKIDAEGAEYDILAGGKEALNITKNILLEVHKKDLEIKCKEILKQYGFNMKEIARETQERSWWFVHKS